MKNRFSFKTYVTMILSILLVLSGCRTKKIPNSGSKSEITIMSFNIRLDIPSDGENRWDLRKEACISMIHDKAADVFGIQEGLPNQVQYLEDKLEAYAKVGIGRDDATDGEACAVFYLKEKYHLLDSNTFWLSETPEKSSFGWDAACRRIVTWVHLKEKFTQKTFYVFNTHFDHMGPMARKNSALLLVDKINEIADSGSIVFITGDFNAVPTDPILEPILEHYAESGRTSQKTDTVYTYNNWSKLPGTRIDFIFYKNATALEYQTIDEDFGVPYISDHYPVMTRFAY